RGLHRSGGLRRRPPGSGPHRRPDPRLRTEPLRRAFPLPLATGLLLWAAVPAGADSALAAVRRHSLPNGLVAILAPDPAAAPLVSVGMMYRVGAKNESAGI